VLVETFRDALTFCDRPEPRTPVEAKFSLQHAVAVVAERGEPTAADFEPDAIAALADARARVQVAEAAEFTARYPDHFGARVTAGGRRVELVDTLGDPERPLSRDGVVAKARALMAWGGLTEDAAERGVALALEGEDPAALVAWLEAVV
jgi:2-methylcitrate dehydratase PrpD